MAIVGRDVRATGSRCLAPSSASRRASARSWAKESSSNGPRTRRTATSRRTSRCARPRPSAGRRASSPQEYADQIVEPSTRSRPRRWPARGSSTLRVADAFFLEALAEIGEGYGGGWADPAERVQVEMVSANPTGPIVVSAARNGALRRLGRAPARVRRPRRGARVLLQRRRRADGALPRVGRRAPARRAGAGGRIPGRVRRGARGGRTATRCRRCSRRSSTRWSASASTSTAGRCRASSSSASTELLPQLDTYEKDGALWARSSAYGDEQDWVLIRSAEKGGAPTYRAADVAYLVDKLERGFDRAIYVLGADHHATARWYAAIARMLGLRPRAGRGAALPVRAPDARRRVGEGVEARRQRRLPRRRDGRDRRRRGALVSRQPRPRPDDRDRPRPGRREVAEEPGLLRAVRARAHRGDPPQRRRGRGDRRSRRRARSPTRRRS